MCGPDLRSDVRHVTCQHFTRILLFSAAFCSRVQSRGGSRLRRRVCFPYFPKTFWRASEIATAGLLLRAAEAFLVFKVDHSGFHVLKKNKGGRGKISTSEVSSRVLKRKTGKGCVIV